MTAARGLPWVLPLATVEIRGFPRQGPRLMVLPRQMPRLWPRHVPRFCPWQTPWYQPWQPTEVRGNCHVNVRGRQTTAISTAIRGHCHGYPPILGNYHGSPRKLPRPQQFPPPSAAIATAILPYAVITTQVRGNCHGNFRRRQTTAISTAIRGNPPIHGNYHESSRQLPQQFPRHSAAIRDN